MSETDGRPQSPEACVLVTRGVRKLAQATAHAEVSGSGPKGAWRGRGTAGAEDEAG